MGNVDIQGLVLTPLKIIPNQKGDILHGIKKSDSSFKKFSEAYFSCVNYNKVKGWNKHLKMTLNLIVIDGSIKFVIYDNRISSHTKNKFFVTELSLKKYFRLTIPPGLWVAFKGTSKSRNLLLNISDFEHDQNEIIKRDLDTIPYTWD